MGELLKVQRMMYPGSPSPTIHLLITADASAALVTSALTLSNNAEATITAAPEEASAEWVARLLAARKTAASVALALKEE